MDSDRTFDNGSWHMQVDDAASKDACTSSGKVPLPDYLTKGSDLKEKKNLVHMQRGAPWTEDEHRQFLYGLQRFGRGNWKNISRYNVQTKSNTQVASHARNYFKRLSSAKEGKRLSINDITTVNPEKLLALEKETTRCMPRCCNEESTKAENQLLPECTTEASFNAENQLPPGYSSEASRKKHRRPCNKNQLLPKAASSCFWTQLLPWLPEKAPTDMGNQPLTVIGSKKPRADARNGHPDEDITDIGCRLLPVPSLFCGKAIGGDIGRRPVEAMTSLRSQLLRGCAMEALTDLEKLPQSGQPDGNRLLPFDGSLFSGQVMRGVGLSTTMVEACDVSSPPFAMELGPVGSVEMPGRHAPSDDAAGFYSTDSVMQDVDVALDAEFYIGSSSTENMDLDMSLFPHFLD